MRTPVRDSDKRWAWVAGASEGLGLAFADALAERGFRLVLFARRAEVLEAQAERLREAHGIEVFSCALDLCDANLATILQEHVDKAPPSLAVYNAAYSPAGMFLDQPAHKLLQAVDVNVRGPLLWSHVLGNSMRDRGGGDLLLMSSLAGAQGSPNISTYAATKAFNTILAEGLWWEFRRHHINVLVCCAGAVRTPGYAHKATSDAPGTLDAAQVAVCALDALKRGPRVVPGWINRLASGIVGRWLPRRMAIGIMARATVDLRD